MTPKITVITVNLNNAVGLKRTIESVIQQKNFSAIEYLVIDGGSSDGSVNVIKEFSDYIAYWVSEKDKGIYDAMNKAIKISSGEYLNFLNSGDHYSSSLSLQKLLENSNNKDIIYSNINVVEKDTIWIKKYPKTLDFNYLKEDTLPHPGSLIKKKLFNKIGLYDTNLKVVADWKFFILSIIKHKASYTYLDKETVHFYLDGISSDPKNKVLINSEFQKTLQEHFNLRIAFIKIKYKFNRIVNSPNRLLKKLQVRFSADKNS